MKELWYTLAVSDIGTHKIRLKEKMKKNEAVNLGKEYCVKKGMDYIGTFYFISIDYEEFKIREKIYSE